MNKVFGYDSKAMRFLSRFSDLLFLNMLFIVCCIPIVTIGAAQAGQYRAVMAMQDPESDYTWSQAFFKGFKEGFLNITLASSFMLGLIVVVGINAFMVVYYENVTKDTNSIVWVSLVGAAILMIFYSTMTLFHSRFGCKPWQLVRNGIVVSLFNPLQAVINAVLMWLPVGVFLVDASLFVIITPAWLLGYYSVVSYFAVHLFKVPFQVLLNNYNEVNGITDENEDEEDEEEYGED